MNPQVKETWVKALRSGEFEQGKGYLKREGKYCCLGVLCELYYREHSIPSPQNDEGYNGKYSTLPIKVREWAGLKFDMGDAVKIGSVTSALAHFNDEGIPFEMIADAIHAQL